MNFYSQNKNWYKIAKKTQALEKEAGIQDALKWLAPAIMAVLMGMAISESAKKYHVPEDKLKDAVSNPHVVQQLKKLHFEMPETTETTNTPKVEKFNLKEYNENNPDNTKAGEINKSYLKSLIEKNEGKKNSVYKDSRGIPTVGIGFNLTRKDAPQKLKDVGANYTKVRNGTHALSDEQIYMLFDRDLDHAISGASTFVPNFQRLPTNVKTILIDMTFNMGIGKLNEFHKFKDAISKNDWNKAKQEMINSKWYRQVGQRGKRLINLLPT